MSDACAICGESDWSHAYDGPIRDGVFGRQRPGRVRRCGACFVEVLVEPAQPPEEYYAEGTYRSDVGEQPDIVFGNSIHDAAMLSLARHAYAINANPDLKQIAQERGWTIYQPD